MDPSASNSRARSPSAQDGADGGLASCLRQLNFAVRDVQFSINRLHDTLDRDTRAMDALRALNEILSSVDSAPSHGPTTRANSPIDDAPVLVGGSDVLPPDQPERWYSVTVGRNPGVFSGSASIPANVLHIPGGSVARYPSREQAEQAFNAALDAGLVERVQIVRTQLSRANLSGN